MRPEVDQFIRDFKSCQFYCRKLIRLYEDLEVLEYHLTYGYHNRADLTPEQLRSSLPMPSNTSRYLHNFDLSLMEDIDKVKAEMKSCRRELAKCEIVEALPVRDFNILADRYWFDVPAIDVGQSYGFSKAGLYRHIDRQVSMILKVKEIVS